MENTDKLCGVFANWPAAILLFTDFSSLKQKLKRGEL